MLKLPSGRPPALCRTALFSSLLALALGSVALPAAGLSGCGGKQSCMADGECESAHCGNGFCRLASCYDGVRNNDESSLDCGGSCAGCEDGKPCKLGSDCLAKVCSHNTCVSSCSDGFHNGTETDTDCGGDMCPRCSGGHKCQSKSDCSSLVCKLGVCTAPSCTDMIQNGDETDLDCGGSCPGCKPGGACHVAVDCSSGNCFSMICQ